MQTFRTLKRSIRMASSASILAVFLAVYPLALFAQFSLSKGTDTLPDFNKCTECGGDLHTIGKAGGCRCTSDSDCQSALNALLEKMGNRDSIGGYSREDLYKLQRENCAFLKNVVAHLYTKWRDKDERRQDAEDAARKAKRDADDAAASQIKTANNALKKAFRDDDPNSLS